MLKKPPSCKGKPASSSPPTMQSPSLLERIKNLSRHSENPNTQKPLAQTSSFTTDRVKNRTRSNFSEYFDSRKIQFNATMDPSRSSSAKRKHFYDDQREQPEQKLWTLKVECESQKKQIALMSDLNGKLQRSLSQLQKKLYIEDESKLQAENQNLNRMLAGFQKKAEERKVIMKQLYGILKTKDQELEYLKGIFSNQIKQTETQMQNLQEHFNQQFIKHQEKLQRVEGHVRLLKSKKQQQLHELQVKEDKMRDILQRLMRKQESKEKIDEVKGILNFIAKEKVKLEQNTPERQKFKVQQFDSMQVEYQQLAGTHEACLAKIEELNRSLRRVTNLTHSDPIKALELGVQELLKSNNQIQSELVERGNQLQVMQERQQHIDAEMQKLQRNWDSAKKREQEMSHLITQIEEHQQQVCNLEFQYEQCQQQSKLDEENNQELIAMNDQLNIQAIKLQQQIQLLTQQIEEQQCIMVTNENIMQSQQNKEKQLCDEIRDLKLKLHSRDQDASSSKYKQQIIQLNNQKESLAEQLEQLQQDQLETRRTQSERDQSIKLQYQALQKQFRTLQAELTASREQYNELQNDYDKQNKTILPLQQINEQYQQKLLQQEMEIVKYNGTFEELNQIIDQQNDKLEELSDTKQPDCVQHLATIQDFEIRLEQLSQLNGMLTKEKEDQQQTIAELEEMVSFQEQQINQNAINYDTKLKQLQQQIEQHKVLIKQNTEDKANLQQQIRKHEANNEMLVMKAQNAEQSFQAQEQLTIALEEQINKMQLQIDQLEQQNQGLLEGKQLYLVESQNEIQILETKQKDYIVQISELNKLNLEVQSALHEQLQQNHEIQKQLDEQFTLYNDRIVQVNELTKCNQQLEVQVIEINEQYKLLQEQTQQVTDQKNILIQEVEDQLRQEQIINQQSKSELISQQEHHNQLKQHNNELENQVNELRQQLKLNEDSHHLLQEQCQILQTQLHDKAGANSNIDKLNNLTNELQNQLEQQQAESCKLQQEINTMTLKEQQYQDQITKITKEIEDLKDYINGLEFDINLLNTNKKQLLNEKLQSEQQIEDLTLQMDILIRSKDVELNKLNEQTTELDEEITSLKGVVNEQKESQKYLFEQNSDLQSKVNVLKADTQQLIAENTQLTSNSEQLAEQLQALKTEFEICKEQNTKQKVELKEVQLQSEISSMKLEQESQNQIRRINQLENQVRVQSENIVQFEQKQVIFTDLETDYSTLQQELQDVQYEVQILHNRLRAEQKAKEEQIEELEDLKLQSDISQRNLVSYKMEIETANESINSLQNKLQEQLSNNKVLFDQNSKIEIEVNQLKSLITTQTEEINQLKQYQLKQEEDQSQQYKQQVENLQIQIKQLTQTNDDLQLQLKTAEDSVTTIQNQFQELQVSSVNKESQLNELLKQAQQPQIDQTTPQQIIDLEEQIQAMTQEQQNLESTIQDLQFTLSIKESQLKNSNQQLTTFVEQVEDLQLQCGILERSMISETQLIKSQLEEEMEKTQVLNEKLNHYKTSSVQLFTVNEELKQQIQTLGDKNLEQQADISNIQNQLEEQNKQCQECQIINDNLNAQIVQLTQHEQQLTKMNNQLTNELQQVTDQLNLRNTELQDSQIQLNSLTEQTVEMNTKNAKLANENQELLNKVSQLTDDYQLLKNSQSQLQYSLEKQITEFTEMLEASNQKCSQLTTVNQELQGNSQKLTEQLELSNQNNNQLTSEQQITIQELSQVNKELLVSQANLLEQNTKLSNQNIQMQQEIEQLNNSISQSKLDNQQIISDLQGQVEQLTKQLTIDSNQMAEANTQQSTAILELTDKIKQNDTKQLELSSQLQDITEQLRQANEIIDKLTKQNDEQLKSHQTSEAQLIEQCQLLQSEIEQLNSHFEQVEQELQDEYLKLQQSTGQQQLAIEQLQGTLLDREHELAQLRQNIQFAQMQQQTRIVKSGRSSISVANPLDSSMEIQGAMSENVSQRHEQTITELQEQVATLYEENEQYKLNRLQELHYEERIKELTMQNQALQNELNHEDEDLLSASPSKPPRNQTELIAQLREQISSLELDMQLQSFENGNAKQMQQSVKAEMDRLNLQIDTLNKTVKLLKESNAALHNQEQGVPLVYEQQSNRCKGEHIMNVLQKVLSKDDDWKLYIQFTGLEGQNLEQFKNVLQIISQLVHKSQDVEQLRNKLDKEVQQREQITHELKQTIKDKSALSLQFIELKNQVSSQRVKVSEPNSAIIKLNQSMDEEEESGNLRQLVQKLKKDMDNTKRENAQLRQQLKVQEDDEDKYCNQQKLLRDEIKTLRQANDQVSGDRLKLIEKLSKDDWATQFEHITSLVVKFFEAYEKETKQELRIYYKSLQSMIGGVQKEEVINRLVDSLENPKKKQSGLFKLFQ